jgi:hypothetical protein
LTRPNARMPRAGARGREPGQLVDPPEGPARRTCLVAVGRRPRETGHSRSPRPAARSDTLGCPRRPHELGDATGPSLAGHLPRRPPSGPLEPGRRDDFTCWSPECRCPGSRSLAPLTLRVARDPTCWSLAWQSVRCTSLAPLTLRVAGIPLAGHLLSGPGEPASALALSKAAVKLTRPPSKLGSRFQRPTSGRYDAARREHLWRQPRGRAEQATSRDRVGRVQGQSGRPCWVIGRSKSRTRL